MTRFKYPDGAKWRRWDLHIHSPDSVLANEFEGSDRNEKWNKYLDYLETITDISVLGITDYYSISGYKRLREEKNNGRLKNIDLILPNVECRFNIRTESNGTVNLHFVFNPDIVNELETRFFSNLSFEYSSRPYKCTKSELIRLGMDYKNDPSLDADIAYREGVNQFKVSIQNIREIFRNDKKLSENVFVVVPNSSKDGNSGVQESGFAASREEIYRVSDAIFSGNPNDEKYFLGVGADSPQEVIRKCGSLKPCIHGSDAHQSNGIGVVAENRFCWIKADPTFEGLKQIKIEPQARVKIQSTNPQHDFSRSYFSEISCSIGRVFSNAHVETSEVALPINPNMCCIVGGRGTGKSLLLDMVKKIFEADSYGRHQDITHSDFKVKLEKNDGEVVDYHIGEDNYIDYLHVSQGDVKTIVSDVGKLDVEIKKMIGMPIEDLTISENSGGYIEKIIEIKDSLEQVDDNGELKYSKAKYSKLIAKNTELIKAITTKENKDLIQQHRDNQKLIIEHSKNILVLEKLASELKLFSETKNSEFIPVNRLVDNIKVEDVDFKTQLQMIIKIDKSLKSSRDKLELFNEDIKQQLNEKGVEGDIAYLLDKVKEYQNNIEHYQQEIEKIDELKKNYSLQFRSLSIEAETVKNNLDSYIGDINDKWNQLKSGKHGWTQEQIDLNKELIQEIEISGSIHFDKASFYEFLLEGLNRGRFRATRTETIEAKLESIFNVQNHEDYLRLISNEEVIKNGDDVPINIETFLSTGSFVKNGEFDFLKSLYSSDKRDKYLKVVSQIKYMGKDPNQLSVGQRGTLYLCLKLATNTFGTPLIYDQPEDDLDNNFIVQHLVPLLRKIKKYRQVILVTHNANIVVNSDSEQIIVAANIGERLFYVSGSIENNFIDDGTVDVLNKKGIKQHICDILEGGLVAFKAREKRYDL